MELKFVFRIRMYVFRDPMIVGWVFSILIPAFYSFLVSKTRTITVYYH